MEHIFLNVFNIILPILICIGAGYWLAIVKASFDNNVINGLINRIGFPTLVISHLSSTSLDTGTFFNVLAAALMMVAGFGVLGFLALKVLRYPVGAFLGPLMHGNMGSIGLPIVLLAFGDVGMAYAMGFVIVILLSMFTIGIWLPSGTVSLKMLFTSPVIYAAIFAIGLVVMGIELPKPINATFNILGGLAIPLLLLTMGHTLATFKVTDATRALILTAVHLAIAVFVALLVVHVFGFTGVERGVVIVACLMPSSVAGYLFADEYSPEEAPEVAGYILVSTIATFIVLPLALTFWI
ncbi:Membrane transport protein [Roseovarius albus]|uniref:Membrane transport protein n=2 Tax=Roseovarius albus TaxID=1247867 RepID=A0A1X6ZCG6_9RHOB|nr:Membrane transport protein [Roseovarius albus]